MLPTYHVIRPCMHNYPSCHSRNVVIVAEDDGWRRVSLPVWLLSLPDMLLPLPRWRAIWPRDGLEDPLGVFELLPDGIVCGAVE